MHNHFRPKFSIITVTFNAEKVIEDTIQSIVTQTYKNIEYLLIDGGSTDRTLEIAGRYREHIHYLCSEPDRGLYDAMNKGLAHATGDYVCFLNAGDCLHEDDTLFLMVRRWNDEWAQHPELPVPDVLYGETAIVDAQGHFVRMRRLAAPKQLNWKSFRHGMLVCHQAFFARRELAPQYDLRYRYSADFDWCIKVMKQARSLFNTGLTVVDYLQEGLTTRHHKASLRERYQIMCCHYGRLSTLLFHAWFVVRSFLKK
jgi:glycosyltransferase involved in cell wall biosynthesis